MLCTIPRSVISTPFGSLVFAIRRVDPLAMRSEIFAEGPYEDVDRPANLVVIDFGGHLRCAGYY